MAYVGGYNYPTAAAASANPIAPDDGSYDSRFHFQAAQNAGFHFGTEDSQPRILHVSNIDPGVTEDFIVALFGQIGHVVKIKIINDAQEPYAFVEFADHHTAAQALQAINKRMLLDKELHVSWATQPGVQPKVDTSRHFHVFVGDLSTEIDNKAIKEAFSPFGEVSDVKVIRDPQTAKSKGYGFVSYPRREEAERAIEGMNGQWLGRRTIRTNWATRKPTGNENEHRGGGASGGAASFGGGGHGRLSVDEILAQSAPDITSVYIGNVPVNATDDDVRAIFKRFGQVVDIRHFKNQGYSFVKFDTHENAARAIYEMNGAELMGQSIRCSWGRSESTRGLEQSQQALLAQINAAAAAYSNCYAANTYWQYYHHYYSHSALQQQWRGWSQANRQPGPQPQMQPH